MEGNVYVPLYPEIAFMIGKKEENSANLRPKLCFKLKFYDD
jgi:hypothetical protein